MNVIKLISVVMFWLFVDCALNVLSMYPVGKWVLVPSVIGGAAITIATAVVAAAASTMSPIVRMLVRAVPRVTARPPTRVTS